MNENKTEKILMEIFKKIAPEIDFKNIDLNLPLRNQVDLDSYDFYKIISLLEERSGVRIPEIKLREFKNPGELIQYVDRSISP